MAGRGPLPNPDSIRHRDHPMAIPTTNLPQSGRKGPAPEIPTWVKLGTAGKAWWTWAWSTPQAAGWGVACGQEAFVARRAQLEDDCAAARIAGDATLPIVKECREIDDRLGLTPKGMAALRWKIVPDAEEPAAPADGATPITSGRRTHLASTG